MSGAAVLRPPGRAARAGKALLEAAARPLCWAVAGVVLVAALVVGSIHPVPTTRAARIAALENVLKCPSCVDLSIRQSDAAAAANLRAEVVRLVDQGRSNAEIERIAVAQYGPSELLVPPASGLGAFAWAIPLAALGGGGAVLAVVLVRRRRQGVPAERLPSAEDEALVEAALGRGATTK